MVAVPVSCQGFYGAKERFESEHQAREAYRRKRKFRHARYPRFYHCPDCHGYHATSLER